MPYHNKNTLLLNGWLDSKIFYPVSEVNVPTHNWGSEGF